MGSKGYRTNLYSLQKPTASEIATILEALRSADTVLDGRALGVAGQNYLYGLLTRSGRFSIPRRKKLGQFVGAGGSEKADLVARVLEPTIPILDKVVFEVKNERQVFNASSEELLEVVRYGLEHRALPVLVAPHFGESALEMCAQVGIHVLPLRRQLVPVAHDSVKRVEQEVEKLRPLVLGPQPTEFVSVKRFYQRRLSEYAERDLAIVKCPEWLNDAATTWECDFSEIAQTVRRGDPWSAVKRDIEDRIARIQRESANFVAPLYY